MNICLPSRTASVFIRSAAFACKRPLGAGLLTVGGPLEKEEGGVVT